MVPAEPVARRQALAAVLAANPHWLHAIDLFNTGYYWEAHEAWEGFWHVFGRTTPEARLVQGLIRLAAACVKIREGTPEGVRRHALRARELLGDVAAADRGADAQSTDAQRSAAESSAAESSAALGISPKSIASVLQELETFRAECWHTSRTPVVRVLAADLRLMRRDGEPHAVEG
jgi:predicted metal-dependent hydrolase